MLRPSRPMIRPFMSSDGQLDERDGRLRGVARGDALQRVGDEVARAPARLGLRLLLELAHAAGELVADELLRARQHLVPSPRSTVIPEIRSSSLELAILRRLQLLLQRLRVHLAVGDALLAAFELGQLGASSSASCAASRSRGAPTSRLRVRSARARPPREAGPPPPSPRAAPRGAATSASRFASWSMQLARPARGGELGAARQDEPCDDEPTTDDEADEMPIDDAHAAPLSESVTRDGRRGAHPPPSRRGRMPRIEIQRTATRRGRSGGLAHPVGFLQEAVACMGSSIVSGVRAYRFDSEMRRMQAKRQMKLSILLLRRGPVQPGASSASSEKPSPGQRARRADAPPPSSRPPRARPLALRLERGRAPARPPRRATPWRLEVAADPVVAVAALRRGARPGRARSARRRGSRRASSVVERVVLRRSEIPARSSFARSERGGVVAPRERPDRPVERPARRLVRPTPAPQRLDRAPASSTAPRRPRRSSPAAAAAAAFFFAADLLVVRRRRPAAAVPRRPGRRRAAPGSAARIRWSTSGCSRRNAVAFWRPWPSRSSSKLKYEPDFWTTFRSSPASSTVPSQEIPDAVDDVELGLLERRRDLVLRHLDADAVADRLDALLERLDAADVEAHGRVELERAAARASSPGCRT